MKRFYFILQFVLFLAFNFVLLLTVYQVCSDSSSMKRLGYKTPVFNKEEEYDPSLGRLNSMQSLMNYCDSLYSVRSRSGEKMVFENDYPALAVSVVSKRFYHGYSLYGFTNNFMAMFLSQVTVKGLSAIVLPQDILQYPYAACSQQSIVLMELLSRKGFSTRKVGFQGKKTGHFCFEVYYAGDWHFYDPDMEPNQDVLLAYNRPGIKFLAGNKDILLKAYAQYDKETVMDIFPNYFYGAVNTFPAKKAMLFQKGSKVLSYTVWILFLGAFVLARRKFKSLSRRTALAKNLYIPRFREEVTTTAFYPKTVTA